MNESQKRAALRQLEEKLSRQKESVEATSATIELLKAQPINNQTGRS